MKLSVKAFWISCLGLIIGCAGGYDPNDVRAQEASPPSISATDRPEYAQSAEYPLSSSACLPADAPIEQPSDLGVCRRNWMRRSTDRDAAGWFQVVAEPAENGEPSTVTILEATLYGVRADGRLVALAGTGVGQAPVVWAGAYLRSPWFGDDKTGGDAFVPLPASESSTYRAEIPTGMTLLHGGPAHADITDYVDVVFVVRAITTGSARIQIGVDLRPRGKSGNINEVALSDWFRSDGGCTRATPRLDSPADCRVPVL